MELSGFRMAEREKSRGLRLGGVPHVAQTKEYLVCVQGVVQVTIAGEKYDLAVGDVFAFPGDQPHSYLNTGKARSICVSVVALAPPGV